MGRRIRGKSIRHGRNLDLDWKDDGKFVRCSRCGWICHTERDRQAADGSRAGWGITYVNAGGWFEEPSGWFRGQWFNRAHADPIVNSGCPQCGTYLYNK